MSTSYTKMLLKVVTYVTAILFLIFIVGPLLWIFISTIFREVDLVSLGKYLELPSRISLTSWKATLRGEFVRSIIHTSIYSMITAIMCTVISTLAAYAFVFLRFRASKTLFYFLFFISTIPGWAVVIPNYINLRQLGLFNTYWVLVFMIGGYLLPFTVWMMVSFLKSVPHETIEAGLVDGCTKISVITRIILPLAAPGAAVVMIYSFIMTWGNFAMPLIFTTGSWAITVQMSSAFGIFGHEYGLVMAQGTLSLVVPVVLAIIFEKYIIKGLTAGSVKG